MIEPTDEMYAAFEHVSCIPDGVAAVLAIVERDRNDGLELIDVVPSPDQELPQPPVHRMRLDAAHRTWSPRRPRSRAHRRPGRGARTRGEPRMKPVKPRLTCGGIFTPDPDIPADHRGRRTCRCGLTGAPGDTHHTPPAPAEADHGQLAAGDQTND